MNIVFLFEINELPYINMRHVIAGQSITKFVQYIHLIKIHSIRLVRNCLKKCIYSQNICQKKQNKNIYLMLRYGTPSLHSRFAAPAKSEIVLSRLILILHSLTTNAVQTCLSPLIQTQHLYWPYLGYRILYNTRNEQQHNKNSSPKALFVCLLSSIVYTAILDSLWYSAVLARASYRLCCNSIGQKIMHNICNTPYGV